MPSHCLRLLPRVRFTFFVTQTHSCASLLCFCWEISGRCEDVVGFLEKKNDHSNNNNNKKGQTLLPSSFRCGVAAALVSRCQNNLSNFFFPPCVVSPNVTLHISLPQLMCPSCCLGPSSWPSRAAQGQCRGVWGRQGGSGSDYGPEGPESRHEGLPGQQGCGREGLAYWKWGRLRPGTTRPLPICLLSLFLLLLFVFF